MKILKWINTNFLITCLSEPQLEHIRELYTGLLNSKGPLNTAKRLKTAQLHVTKFYSGEPLFINSDNVSVNKKGLPKLLGPLMPLALSKDPEDFRTLMTALLLARGIPCRGKPDYSSITDKGPNVISKVLMSEVKEVLKDLNWSIDTPKWTKFHPTTKVGPNGQALVSSLLDAHLLTQEIIDDIAIVGNSEDLVGHIKSVRTKLTKEFCLSVAKPKRDKLVLGKVAVKSDPYGKERLIAVIDYWSQTALKPLHDNLFDLLKRIDGDCTFNQSTSTKWLPKDQKYYSLDLKAATDRFPVKLQSHILGCLKGLDHKFSKSWEGLLVGREFLNHTGTGFVKYEVGQPMGCYSSWASFALSHHLIVRIAAKRSGKPVTWCNYALLGDDLVLTDLDVVINYKQIMSELGVSINLAKSHESFETWEFAKRWYTKHKEVSGIQTKAFLNTKSWAEFAASLESELLRMGQEAYSLVPGVIGSGLQACGSWYRDRKLVALLLNLPRNGGQHNHLESKLLNLEKAWLSSFLGCRRSMKTLQFFLMESLGSIKIAVVQKSIVALFQKARPFINGLLAGLESTDMDPQSAVRSVPIIAVVRDEALKLQTCLQTLKTAYESGDSEKLYFLDIPITLLDPERIDSTRASVKVLNDKGNLVSKYRNWFCDYSKTRSKLLSDDQYFGGKTDS